VGETPAAATPVTTLAPTTSAPEAAQAQSTIEVTYFTPAQAEGPYYPLQKPDDRDNDLTRVPGAAGLPAGQRLLLQGKVYDRSGQPLEGVLIEIWQTDEAGIYLHPGDANTARRDPNFQFYGEALTAADGSYSFLTVIPGEYEPRPRHIHVKLKRDGRELLTTQFYFPDDLATGADGIFASAGDAANALLVALQPGSDDQGELLLGERDVILDLDS
jgi:protocatechuate 3,4-dioxygenase beta subunit